VVRTEGLLDGEEMISRLRARIEFLHHEHGTHHLVLLDTDMLVVRPLHHVFHSHDPFDVALTWRHELNMPINGGILLVPRDRLNKAADFMGCASLLPLRWSSVATHLCCAEVVCPSVAPASPQASKRTTLHGHLHLVALAQHRHQRGTSPKQRARHSTACVLTHDSGGCSAMLELTEGFVGNADARRRWFGQSDQVALASLLTKQHGFHGIMPGTPQAKRQLDAHTTIRTRYRYPADAGNATGKQVFKIALLSCTLYNGAGATVS
jgi:hypothetical protein